MDFATYLKDAVVSFFKSFEGRADAAGVVETLKTWGFDYGFNRSTNTTDHKSTIEGLRGQASKRVSLDKYENGENCIIINRMQANDAKAIFLSAVHGAILAWRRNSGAKTDNGRERLIDAEFTALAQYVGLIKIAEERPVTKDGTTKMVKVADSTARVWFGANQHLDKIADAFAASCPELPAAYIGTDEKNNIGTILLPGKIRTASGSIIEGYFRVPSWTAALNKVAKGEEKTNIALDRFIALVSHADVTLDVKNKSYKLLLKLKAEVEAPQPVEEPKVEAALAAVEQTQQQKKPVKPVPQKKAS